MTNFLSYIILAATLLSCNRSKENTKSNAFDHGATKIIGHKGNGDIGKNGNSEFISNSTLGIIHAMKHTYGSEMDVQISSDTTLWLFHDHEMIDCNDTPINIALLTDQQIEIINKCQYNGQLTSLEKLLDSLSMIELKNKTISLDLKLLMNQQSLQRFGGEENLSEILASKLMQLEKLNNFNTLLEIPSKSLLALFDQNTPFQTYLLVYDSYDFKNLKKDGLSLSIENAKKSPFIKEGKSTNYQLWTANRAEEMLDALSLNPDYIQTDNIALADFIISHDVYERKSLVKEKSLSYEENEEYIMLEEIALKSKTTDFMLNFSYSEMENKNSETLLVFSSKNQDGESCHWEGYALSDSSIYEFINPNFMMGEGCEMLKIYLWNNKQQNNKIDGITLELISPNVNQSTEFR